MQYDKVEDFIMSWEIKNHKVELTADHLIIDNIYMKYSEIKSMRENKKTIVIKVNELTYNIDKTSKGIIVKTKY